MGNFAMEMHRGIKEYLRGSFTVMRVAPFTTRGTIRAGWIDLDVGQAQLKEKIRLGLILSRATGYTHESYGGAFLGSDSPQVELKYPPVGRVGGCACSFILSC